MFTNPQKLVIAFILGGALFGLGVFYPKLIAYLAGDSASIAVAGQFGDQYGFANACLSLLSTVFLAFSYWHLVKQHAADVKSSKNNDAFRSMSSILHILNENRNLIKVRDGIDSFYNHDQYGSPFDKFTKGTVRRSFGDLPALFDTSSILIVASIQDKLNNNISDMERYFNSVHSAGVLVNRFPEVDWAPILSAEFTGMEILFLEITAGTKMNQMKVGIRFIVDYSIKHNLVTSDIAVDVHRWREARDRFNASISQDSGK